MIQATVTSANSVTNSATITHAEQFDPNTGNNTATATETPQQADLALSKTVDNPTPNVGDTITYTITLSDNGPNSATNVQVTDLLPAGRTFVSAIASQGTYNPVNGLWTVGSVDTAAARTLRIQAQVTSATTTVNSATITHADQFDPVLTNNTATTSTSPEQADLAVTKTVNDPTPNVGETIAYTITLTDNGPSNATGVILQDMLPAGLTFVSATPSQGTYVPAPTSTWTVGSVANGSSAVLTIQATVVSPNPATNSVTITHSDQFDPNTGNNTATSVVTPQQADLVLTKTVSNPTPNVGDTVTFTVTARDAGPSTATGVTVQDLLPAGVTFVSATPSRGSYNSGTGTWTIGTLNLSTAQTLVIQATVASPNPSTNTATISHADQFDPNTANNTASVVVTPQQADLALAKAVSDPQPNVGDTITYIVTLSDNGPNTATSVQVTDLLPAGVTFVSAAPSQGTYQSSTGLWNVGTVTTSTPQTLFLTGTVVSPNSSTNTATISRADQFDPNTANNTASVVVTPQQADLALAKAVSDPQPNVGDTITYIVTLSNNGPTNNATNVRVTDLLPAGLSLVSDTPSQGTYVAGTGLWTVGTVVVGTPQTLVILATVTSSSPQTNTATITDADQFDPVVANNTAAVVVTPQQADLVLSKTVDDPTPNVGDVIAFTVTLGNSGPTNNATNVQVTDLLPSGLSFVSDTPSQGAYNPATGLWTVGTVSTTVPQTLLIQATVLGPGAQTNAAAVTHSDQFDPNTGNNTATATEAPQQADLSISKTVDNPTPNVGNVITYTITLGDNGPDSSTNVQVTDLLPSGRFFLSATTTQGLYDPITGLWTVGTVVTTGPQTLRIRALVTSAVATVNTATITGADQFDPVTANNTATTSSNPQQADLSVTKTVNDPTPNVGETVAYTITLTDHGPDDATNVTVRDVLPAGLTFVSATPGQGTYDPAASTWTAGGVADGSSAVLTIRATVVSPNHTTNFAVITHSDQFDPNLGNNAASTTLTPQQADLFLSKAVNNSAPNVGDTIAYTVTVGDNGPDSATNVAVADLLPAGVTFVSATPSRGSYNSATGAWTIGTVDPSTAQTLVIRATVTSPNRSRNRATISHADQFDPNATNNTASVFVTPQQADLALSKSVSNPTPNVGDTTSYTVTLTDNEPGCRHECPGDRPAPRGPVAFVSAALSQGTYSPATGLWSVGTVNVGSPATLVVQATVISPGSQTNTATITGTRTSSTPTTANNTASGHPDAPAGRPRGFTKTTSDPIPNVGDTVAFTVTLSDLGPDAATNAQVTDLLPAGRDVRVGHAEPGGLRFHDRPVDRGDGRGRIAPDAADPGPDRWSQPVDQYTQQSRTPTSSTPTRPTTPASARIHDAAAGRPGGTTKSVSNPALNVGDTITYTITLTVNSSEYGPRQLDLGRVPPSTRNTTINAIAGTFPTLRGLATPMWGSSR